jgi:hypothetical protein
MQRPEQIKDVAGPGGTVRAYHESMLDPTFQVNHRELLPPSCGSAGHPSRAALPGRSPGLADRSAESRRRGQVLLADCLRGRVHDRYAQERGVRAG